jgi:hypothetical protein
MDCRYTSARLFLLGHDCRNKRGDCLMSYYWRIAEKYGWDGPAPLGVGQGLADRACSSTRAVLVHLTSTTFSEKWCWCTGERVQTYRRRNATGPRRFGPPRGGTELNPISVRLEPNHQLLQFDMDLLKPIAMSPVVRIHPTTGPWWEKKAKQLERKQYHQPLASLLGKVVARWDISCREDGSRCRAPVAERGRGGERRRAESERHRGARSALASLR